MNSLSTLLQNRDFFAQAYNINAVVIALAVLAIVDVILKGFALWRAAQLSKRTWFIALLIINSAGILPLVFLLMSNSEYERHKSLASADRSQSKN